MKLTGFSLEHRTAVFLLSAGIVAIGWASYRAMPRESFPDVEFPFIVVTTTLDGANPIDVEESITIPLETELDGLEGLREMRSVSAEGSSMVSLEFAPDVETMVALERVRDAVAQARGEISPEAEEPVVKEFSMTSVPILIYQLVGTGRVAPSELHALAEKLETELSLVPEVLDVDVFGGRDEEILVELDPGRLHHYAISLERVQAIATGTNRNVSAGTAQSETNRIVMRVPGAYERPDDILGLPIGRSADGAPIYLRDVGTVRYDFEDEVTRSRLYDLRAADGLASSGVYAPPRASVSLHVKKRAGANVLEMCRKADEVIASHPLPEDVRIVKSLDNSKIVRSMVADLENGIGTSLVLVLLVIFFGMGGRNALLVASAIPFSMFLSIIVLAATGNTLNMMVLFSLILALGMLVDNAIVVIENVDRHLSMGRPRVEAAYRGTTEVAWPVITSTATTVGAFLPLLFWPGIIGEFMGFLPRTVIIVLVASLFVALVINPTLAAIFMRRRRGAPEGDPESARPTYWLVRRYQRLLEFLLDRPAWTLATTATLLVLILAAYGVFGAGTEFFPPTEPDLATCSIRPPEGTSLAESDRMALDLEARILGAPGSGWDAPVENVKFCSVIVGLEGVGGAGPSGMGEDAGGPVRAQIEFVDREYRTEPTPATIAEMRRRIEGVDRDGRRIAPPLHGAEIDVLEPKGGPPAGKPLSIDVFGRDLDQMSAVIRDMKAILESIPGAVKPTDDAVTAQPTLRWDVDRGRAGLLGLDQMTIASVLQIAVGGLVAGTQGHGDDEKDIRVRFARDFPLDLERLANATIPSPTGASVPLASVVRARLVPGPVTIKHHAKRRVLNAGAEVQAGIRNDAGLRAEFQEKVRAYPFPAGITYRFGGAAENQQEAVEFLSRAFLIAIFLILMMLVLQFDSLSVTGIVLTSVVLSLMGVFLGLLVLGAPFGIVMTGIGVISLAGVVVNNAIVLLDAIRQRERLGLPTREAIVTASMIRFRPVLLTAITTILGLVPMALKLNWDFRAMAWQYDTTSSQWWQSMSTAVIFGLLVATVLTLGVVPALYLLTSRLRSKSASVDTAPRSV